MDAIDGKSLRGHLDTMILAALESGETHGFELWRRLERAGCGELRLREGSLYPALYRLEKAGALRARWENDQARRGPRRRIYRITPRGRRTLADRRRQWERFTAVVGSIIVGGTPA